MILLEVILWITFLLFLQTWIAYPVILTILSFRRKQAYTVFYNSDRPSVSVVVAAYNAVGKISHKIDNTLHLDYPVEKMEIIIVSDGSSDGTENEARSVTAPNIKVHALHRNHGKSTAQNEGVRLAKGDIIVFTDVDSELDRGFLVNLIPYFSDPNIACVGGTAVHKSRDGSISASQGSYWRLEQFIRRAESDLGVLISLPGWGFAVRKSDFVPLDLDTGDDMVLPMEMALRGKSSVLAPNAFVTDTMPDSIKGEMKARQRITLRNLTALMRRKRLLNPLRYPLMAFGLWSHKLLRWLSPVLMLVILLSSAALAAFHPSMIYKLLLILQLVGYAFCAFGLISIFTKIKIPVAGQLASFLLANIGFFLGVLRYATGRKIRGYSNN